MKKKLTPDVLDRANKIALDSYKNHSADAVKELAKSIASQEGVEYTTILDKYDTNFPDECVQEMSLRLAELEAG